MPETDEAETPAPVMRYTAELYTERWGGGRPMRFLRLRAYRDGKPLALSDIDERLVDELPLTEAQIARMMRGLVR